MMIPAVVVILYLYLRVKHTYGGAFFYFTNDGIDEHLDWKDIDEYK